MKLGEVSVWLGEVSGYQRTIVDVGSGVQRLRVVDNNSWESLGTSFEMLREVRMMGGVGRCWKRLEVVGRSSTSDVEFVVV